jgi:hypothetical protein
MKWFKTVRNKFEKYARYRNNLTAEQAGAGVITRRQAAAQTTTEENNVEEQLLPTVRRKRKKNPDEVPEEHNLEPELPDSNIEIELEPVEPAQQNEDDLFNSETLVAENELVQVFIIKDYFKRQQLFKYNFIYTNILFY